MKKILWYTVIITSMMLLGAMVGFFSSCSSCKATIGKSQNEYRYHNYTGEFGSGHGNKVY